MKPSDDDLAALRGATPEEVVQALVPEGWKREPSARGGGIRYNDGKGNQVRIMPGDQAARSPDHRGPYAIASFNGKATRILLRGNPALDEDV